MNSISLVLIDAMNSACFFLWILFCSKSSGARWSQAKKGTTLNAKETRKLHRKQKQVKGLKGWKNTGSDIGKGLERDRTLWENSGKQGRKGRKGMKEKGMEKGMESVARLVDFVYLYGYHQIDFHAIIPVRDPRVLSIESFRPMMSAICTNT